MATGMKYSARLSWKKFTSIAIVMSVIGLSSISASSSWRSLSAAVNLANSLSPKYDWRYVMSADRPDASVTRTRRSFPSALV